MLSGCVEEGALRSAAMERDVVDQGSEAVAGPEFKKRLAQHLQSTGVVGAVKVRDPLGRLPAHAWNA